MADSILPSFLRPNKKSSLLVLALYTFIFSFLMPDAGSLWSDYGQILSKQSYLMTDFTAMGMAATFFNVACHFVIAYILVYTTRGHALMVCKRQPPVSLLATPSSGPMS